MKDNFLFSVERGVDLFMDVSRGREISANYVDNSVHIESSPSEKNSMNMEDSQGGKSDDFKNGRWSEFEHKKFIEAILLFGNEWKKVQSYIKTRSSTQARSHAQKFFIRLKSKLIANNISLDYMEKANSEKKQKYCDSILGLLNECLMDNGCQDLMKDKYTENGKEKLIKMIFNFHANSEDFKNKRKLSKNSKKSENSTEKEICRNRESVNSNSNIFHNNPFKVLDNTKKMKKMKKNANKNAKIFTIEKSSRKQTMDDWQFRPLNTGINYVSSEVSHEMNSGFVTSIFNNFIQTADNIESKQNENAYDKLKYFFGMKKQPYKSNSIQVDDNLKIDFSKTNDNTQYNPFQINFDEFERQGHYCDNYNDDIFTKQEENILINFDFDTKGGKEY